MAYTVGDLLEIFRREVDDPTYFSDAGLPQGNTLWSNYQLIQMLDEAQRIWAERTLGFKDYTTFTLDIIAGENVVDYDPRIIKIERADLVSAKERLALMSMEEFSQAAYYDDYGRAIRAAIDGDRTGTPRVLITDAGADTMIVWPKPTEDDTVTLYVRRRPLSTLTAATDDLEVPEAYQLGLLHRVRSEAYSQPKALAAGFAESGLKAAADWETFLLRCSSRNFIRSQRPGRMRYGGL